MSQYRSGRVLVKNGSSVVIAGTGVDWSTVTTGDWFAVRTTNATYDIGSTEAQVIGDFTAWSSGTTYAFGDRISYSGVIYVCVLASLNNNPSTATTYWWPTSGWVINLTAPYAGDNGYNREYGIVSDFTEGRGLPLPHPGDIEIPALVSRALVQIDDAITVLEETSSTDVPIPTLTVKANIEGTTELPAAVPITTDFKAALALVKADVGLTSVDDTADTDKPVSTAQGVAIAARQKKIVFSETAPTTGLEEGLEWVCLLNAIRYTYTDGAFVELDGGDPLPVQVSGPEIIAGTETAIRSYSVADVVAIVNEHAAGGASYTTGMAMLWPRALAGSIPAGWAESDGSNGTSNEADIGSYLIMVKMGGTVAAPSFSPAGGTTYGSTQNVTITSATSGVTIKYTVDGSTPSRTVGSTYSTPVAIASTATLKAIAYRDFYVDSSVTSSVFTIATAPTHGGSWTIGADGLTHTLTGFSENISFGGGGSTGFVANMSGGAVTLTLSSGTGSTTLVFTGSREVIDTETETGDKGEYTQPGSGARSTAYSIDLATFTGHTITNDSAVTGGSVPTPDVLHWPLDDSAGSTIVAAVGSGSTTCTGTLNDDYLSMATGNGNFQSTSAVAWGSDVVTVAFWLRISSWGGTQAGAFIRSCYVGATPRFEIVFDSGSLRASITGTTGGRYDQLYLPFATDTWVHIAMVLDNSTSVGSTKFYLNGSLQTWDTSASDKTSTGDFATDQLSIKSIFSEASFFDMDDLRIYGSEIASGDIAAIHAAGRP